MEETHMTNSKHGAIVFATLSTVLAVLVTSAVTVLAISPIFNTVQYLTFSAPVALPGVTLEAGEYSFQVNTADSGNVVQVRSRQSRRAVFTGFTLPVERPTALPNDALVTFGEAQPGKPRPIRAWFPIDGNRGYEFLYAGSAH
jgi:hypothetical protein